MRRGFFSLPGQLLLWFFASKLSLKIEATAASSVVNWCSEQHCKNCAKSEIFVCSKNALSTPCGDLCGCCQSCVQFRDFGESCGSQLAVRYQVNNFINSTETRVSILATSHCKRGFICVDFICQRKNGKIDGRSTFEDWRNEKPAPITFIREIFLKIGSSLSHVSTDSKIMTSANNRPVYKSAGLQLYDSKNSENRTSRRVLNLIIADKEFQLIYGHEALADLKILLGSLETTQSNSIFNEIETQTLYEKFKIIFSDKNATKSGSVGKKETPIFPKTLGSAENSRREVKKCCTKDFLEIQKFRTKRETENVKIEDHFEVDQKNRDLLDGNEVTSSQINDNKRGEYLAFDNVKEGPKKMENLNHQIVTRQVEAEVQEKDLGGVESAINLHVKGVPRLAKTIGDRIFEEELRDEKAYQSYDEDFEIFVTAESKDLKNLTKNLDNDTKNALNSSFSNKTSKMEHKCPERLHSHFLQDLLTNVNETAEEIRDRLTRIETTVVTIGNWILEIFFRNEASGFDEKAAPNISTMTNTNSVQEEIDGSTNLGPKEGNQYFGKLEKASRLGQENLTDSSGRRQWRTLMVQPNFNAQENLRTLKRGPFKPNSTNESDKNRLSRRSSRKNSESFLEAPPEEKLLPDDTETLTESNHRIPPKHHSPKLTHRKSKMDRLFADEQSINVDDPSLGRLLRSNQRKVWPSSPHWRQIIESARNRRVQSPVDDAFGLETQISKPTRYMSRFDARHLRKNSGRQKSFGDELSGQFGGGSDDQDWDVVPSFNLFAVEGQRSDLGSSDFAESSQNIIQPVGKIPFAKMLGNLDDGLDRMYPEYLDYSEKLQDKVDQKIVEVQTTEAPEKNPRARRIDSKSSRKKRSSGADFRAEENKFNGFASQRIPNIDDPNDLDPAERVNRVKMINSGEINEGTSGKSTKRSRRGVQMVDWLRAAQEYHERLNQVRKAALKTWLASRDEVEDTNLTGVKLFTREIPAYLEKYTPGYVVENESTSDETRNVDPFNTSPTENRGIVSNESPESEVDSKDTSKQSLEESAEISSSTVPRKFTIITTGNSTIRIEEMPEFEDEEDSFEDEPGQSSTNREVVRTPFRDFESNDSEDFDHMYESFDTEDDDFDYDDMSFTFSRLIDDADIINENGDSPETTDDFFDQDEDFAEIFTRPKRDSPFFLFKVRGNPSQEVIVWPSNWKDLINRHLKNRSKILTTKPPKKRLKILKIKPQSDGQDFYSRAVKKETIRHEDDPEDSVKVQDSNYILGSTGDRRQWK